MSIPIRFNIKMNDGTIFENYKFFNISYGRDPNDVEKIEIDIKIYLEYYNKYKLESQFDPNEVEYYEPTHIDNCKIYMKDLL